MISEFGAAGVVAIVAGMAIYWLTKRLLEKQSAHLEDIKAIPDMIKASTEERRAVAEMLSQMSGRLDRLNDTASRIEGALK